MVRKSFDAIFKDLLLRLAKKYGFFTVTPDFPLGTLPLKIDALMELDMKALKVMLDQGKIGAWFQLLKQQVLVEFKSERDTLRKSDYAKMMAYSFHFASSKEWLYQNELLEQLTPVFILAEIPSWLKEEISMKPTGFTGIYYISRFFGFERWVLVILLDEFKALHWTDHLLLLFSKKRRKNTIRYLYLECPSFNEDLDMKSFITRILLFYSEEVIEMAEELGESLPIKDHIAELIQIVGIKETIQRVGLKTVIEEVGLKTVIEEVGIIPILEELSSLDENKLKELLAKEDEKSIQNLKQQLKRIEDLL